LIFQVESIMLGAVPRIRFKFSPSKARAAIIWILRQTNRADLHLVLKTCYFADKEHLNNYGRPIFGATYRAMKYGPVPEEIYEMLKGEFIWLPELNVDHYPWKLNGYYVSLTEAVDENFDVMSDTDMDCLGRALIKSSEMTFNERTAATHGPDWQAAELGTMRYEDMIDEDKRERLIPYLRETAQNMRL